MNSSIIWGELLCYDLYHLVNSFRSCCLHLITRKRLRDSRHSAHIHYYFWNTEIDNTAIRYGKTIMQMIVKSKLIPLSMWKGQFLPFQYYYFTKPCEFRSHSYMGILHRISRRKKRFKYKTKTTLIHLSLQNNSHFVRVFSPSCMSAF